MNLDRFQKWALATLAATVFLVFVGGAVRVSGAGLGCPDWPRCWGHWFPPDSVAAIDPSAHDVSQFNAVKMWTEYLNRLVGVAVGILILGTFGSALADRRSDRPLVAATALAVALVVFQGWLGGRVVKSGLHGGMVTIHLACAVLMVALLIWVVYRAAGSPGSPGLAPSARAWLRGAAATLFVLSVIQLVLGAEVREAIDETAMVVAATGLEFPRDGLVDAAGGKFVVHRTFAWTLGAAAVVLVWLVVKRGLGSTLSRIALAAAGLVAVQVVTGVSLAYFSMPRVSQVVHLGAAVVLCAVAFLLVLLARRGSAGAEFVKGEGVARG